MKNFFAGLFVAASALMAVSASNAELARVDILVPSVAGGCWDQTGHALQQTLRAEKISNNVQVTNVPGAGGTIGLAEFATTKKGKPNVLLVGGFTLVSSAITNKSAVSLANVLPIARLTGEYEILVVPSNSPFKK